MTEFFWSARIISFKSTSSSWKVRYISILKMEICLSVKKTKINLCRYLKSTTTPLTTSVWMAVTAVVSWPVRWPHQCPSDRWPGGTLTLVMVTMLATCGLVLAVAAIGALLTNWWGLSINNVINNAEQDRRLLWSRARWRPAGARRWRWWGTRRTVTSSTAATCWTPQPLRWHTGHSWEYSLLRARV